MIDLAKLDICFVAGTLGQGGAERQLYYILRALTGSGARVRLLSLTRGEFWEEPIRGLGIPVVWVGERATKSARLRRIIAELWRSPPHVLQSQHFFTNLYATAAARILGVPGIGAIRSNCTAEVRSNGPILGRLSLRLPPAIAANSRGAIVQAEVMGVSPSRLFLLPNIVDVEEFRPGAARLSTGPIRLLAVGRLEPAKRFDIFLAALARMHALTPGRVIGTIVGDGRLRESLKRQAASLGLTHREIEFRGSVPDPVPVYREADILVLTSDHEGTPNVLLEAMAMGLPVVATRVGGVPEVVVDRETGLLTGRGDVDALTGSLLALVADADLRLRMGTRAREVAVADHSPARLQYYLREIYDRVMIDH